MHYFNGLDEQGREQRQVYLSELGIRKSESIDQDSRLGSTRTPEGYRRDASLAIALQKGARTGAQDLGDRLGSRALDGLGAKHRHPERNRLRSRCRTRGNDRYVGQNDGSIKRDLCQGSPPANGKTDQKDEKRCTYKAHKKAPDLNVRTRGTPDACAGVKGHRGQVCTGPLFPEVSGTNVYWQVS